VVAWITLPSETCETIAGVPQLEIAGRALLIASDPFGEFCHSVDIPSTWFWADAAKQARPDGLEKVLKPIMVRLRACQILRLS
jgi:hypothetical protein